MVFYLIGVLKSPAVFHGTLKAWVAAYAIFRPASRQQQGRPRARGAGAQGQDRGAGTRSARILVPVENVRQIKDGKRRDTDRKLYPGYVFIELELDKNGMIPEKVWFTDQGDRRRRRFHRLQRQAHADEPQGPGQDAGRGRAARRQRPDDSDQLTSAATASR